MDYGTPGSPEEVLEYYTDIRRGRPPTAEQLADLVRRYDAIGGVSPLAERTSAQVGAVRSALDELAPRQFSVVHGSKHARPRIEDAVDELAEHGIERLAGLVLAPHYSALSVGEYIERANERAIRDGLEAVFVESWHDDPTLVDLLAERVSAAVEALDVQGDERLELVVSAHSLPARILDSGDRYPGEIAETARLVAARAGVAHYRTGWQSAGRTQEPWLGPDILELLAILAGDGVDAVVVCPAGFTSDHLEVLYDLDVDAQRVAGELGIRLARTTSLNADPRLAAALARRVQELVSRTWGGAVPDSTNPCGTIPGAKAP